MRNDSPDRMEAVTEASQYLGGRYEYELVILTAGGRHRRRIYGRDLAILHHALEIRVDRKGRQLGIDVALLADTPQVLHETIADIHATTDAGCHRRASGIDPGPWP
jgi:hypothetical protein